MRFLLTRCYLCLYFVIYRENNPIYLSIPLLVIPSSPGKNELKNLNSLVRHIEHDLSPFLML